MKDLSKDYKADNLEMRIVILERKIKFQEEMMNTIIKFIEQQTDIDKTLHKLINLK